MSFDSPAIEKQIDYSYSMEYNYAQKAVCIVQSNHNYRITVDDVFCEGSYKRVRSFIQSHSLFPQRIIAFYSGANNKLLPQIEQINKSYVRQCRNTLVRFLKAMNDESERFLPNFPKRKYNYCDEGMTPIYLASILCGQDSFEQNYLVDACHFDEVQCVDMAINIDKVEGVFGRGRFEGDVPTGLYYLTDFIDHRFTDLLSQVKYLARVVEKEKTEIAVPYWSIAKSMQDTGEIYCNLGGDLTEQAIQKYNDCLDDWERQKGYEIISDGNVACIAAYEASTLFILNKLLELSQLPNKGQKEVNERYLRDCNIAFSDPKKEETLKYAFVNSRVLLIYGAAGTGKTTLIDMISTMLSGRRKLFLTKTHTALQNLQRRINNPGADASFVSINSFTKRVNLPDYDVIFVDECSTIDNRAMKVFLEKMRPDTFLVLAGDTYQIESIDFGNWFTYAKDIIKTKGSNVELVSTWRTKDPGLIELWNETRNKGALITEKLVIDGPFSENIGEGVLCSEIMDEVILCLNYDGKFGLNNMNSYFQNANTETAVVWRDWKYKVGDHILFNDTDRFSLLYNNLKGRIVQIELFDSRIRFTVDVEIPLTEQDCQNDGIEFIDIIDDVTRIRFDVFDFEEEMADEDRKKTIVPFQLAYAVSIHKAQGLEYRSVKVVIPSSNAEKITHGIFYTAITRAKEKLKIYWSSETMQEVVAGFSIDTSRQKSLAIIKEKLKQDKNT